MQGVSDDLKVGDRVSFLAVGPTALPGHTRGYKATGVVEKVCVGHDDSCPEDERPYTIHPHLLNPQYIVKHDETGKVTHHHRANLKRLDSPKTKAD